MLDGNFFTGKISTVDDRVSEKLGRPKSKWRKSDFEEAYELLKDAGRELVQKNGKLENDKEELEEERDKVETKLTVWKTRAHQWEARTWKFNTFGFVVILIILVFVVKCT